PARTSSRLGPTVPFAPAGEKVWQAPPPRAAKKGFSASRAPYGGYAGAVGSVVVGRIGAGSCGSGSGIGSGCGAVSVGSPAASPSWDSLANTSTAPSGAILRSAGTRVD